jgi:hypothetical protein
MPRKKPELPAGLAEAMAKLIVDAAQAGGKDPFEFARQLNGTAEASPNRRAWVHQLKKQVDSVGTDAASWYVSWRDPEGVLRTKSCGPGTLGESAAKKLADKTHSELVTGTYQAKGRKLWSAFREDFNAKIATRYDGVRDSSHRSRPRSSTHS